MNSQMKKNWMASVLLAAFVVTALIVTTGSASPALAKTTTTYEVPFGATLVLKRARAFDWSLSLAGQWTGVNAGPAASGVEGVVSLNLRMKGMKSFYWKVAGGPGIATVQGVDGEIQYYVPSTTEFGGLGFRPMKWLELSFVGRHRAVVQNSDLLNSAFAELQVGLYLDNWLVAGSAGVGYGRFPVLKPIQGVKWPEGTSPPQIRDAETGLAQTFGLAIGRRF